jgi:lipoate---protein ligase
MKLLPLTLSSIEANLALDEALLEEAEAGSSCGEVLRLWESPTPAVIVGRASKISIEVNAEAAAKDEVPVCRRCSGGTAVVLGPGCLVYSLLLSQHLRPQLQNITWSHQLVMERLCIALDSIPHLTGRVTWEGTCDLVLENKKFSGNSLRCKRDWVLYHGTLLYDFRLSQIDRWLGYPPREPDYRQKRSHLDFLINLGVDRKSLEEALKRSWEATEILHDWPAERTEELMASRYLQPQWHLGK